MLCAEQLELAADALVPQRDVLLDAREMAPQLVRLLSAQADLPVNDCRIAGCRYRFGESLRVLYRIELGGAAHWISARTFEEARGEEVCQQAAKDGVASGPLLACAYDKNLKTVFWSFPNDRKLRWLAQLAFPQRQFRRSIHPRWARTTPVAYAPESRATFCCTSAAGKPLAYLKVHRPEDACRVRQIYSEAMRAAGEGGLEFFTPQLGATYEEFGALFLAPIAGMPLAQLPHADLMDAIGRLGRALAVLHGLPAPPKLPRFSRHNPEKLLTAAWVIGKVRSELSNAAADLGVSLFERGAPAAGADVFLHGDVHLKNAMQCASKLFLVDLDQASVGPAAADLGSCLALLRYRRRLGLYTEAFERQLVARFRAGYAAVRPLPDPEALRWHTAAALLVERGLRSVSRLRSQGLACLDVLLDDATNILRGDEWNA